MELDANFARELKKNANGDGSRDAKFSFLKPAQEAANELSTTDVKNRFNKVIQKYGRCVVAVCVAATVVDRQDRLSQSTVTWGREVLSHWTNRPSDIASVRINDGLHPTRIEEYAAELIHLTSFTE